MKPLLTTVLTLALFAIGGCGDESSSGPETPPIDAHSEHDGHNHAKDVKSDQADGEDHTGHDD